MYTIFHKYRMRVLIQVYQTNVRKIVFNYFDFQVQYPYFMRTVPPDSIQGVAIVNVIKDLGWSKIALLYSTSDYGSSSTFFKRHCLLTKKSHKSF